MSRMFDWRWRHPGDPPMKAGYAPDERSEVRRIPAELGGRRGAAIGSTPVPTLAEAPRRLQFLTSYTRGSQGVLFFYIY